VDAGVIWLLVALVGAVVWALSATVLASKLSRELRDARNDLEYVISGERPY
jgi:hypothetical protein